MTIATAKRFGQALIDAGISVSSVPCGDCHLCCKTTVVMSPERVDKVDEYETQTLDGLVTLRKNGNACVYLTPNGCSIHGKAPFVCRAFDCRKIASIPFTIRRKAVREGLVSADVIIRGQQLNRHFKE